MGKHKKNLRFDSIDFINYVWAKRILLITISIIAFIISAIVSLTITPKFKSAVVLFPASSASISKSLLSRNTTPQNDIVRFGGEEEGEQLMQVLNSEEIRGKIIQKFNLAHHYKIDTTKGFWRTALFGEYKGNIKFMRTELMSVVIEVLDTKPDTAALIANEISNQVDSVMTRIQHDRAKQGLAIVEKEYNAMVDQMHLMEDSLKKIGELGVVNNKSQSKAFNDAYAKVLVEGKTQGAKLIENKLKILAKYGGNYDDLTNLLLYETQRLSELKGKYMEAKVDAEQSIPHKFVVDRAYPSERKAYPKRSLIVLMSTLSAFFVALLLLIIRDSINIKTKD
jgi:uncharacterized protein involved in exopolysaccharide biosynthesis